MTIHKVLRQNDDATVVRMTAIRALNFSASASSDQEVDGEVGDGEHAAECAGHAFHPLHGLLVLKHTALELREPPGLADCR